MVELLDCVLASSFGNWYGVLFCFTINRDSKVSGDVRRSALPHQGVFLEATPTRSGDENRDAMENTHLGLGSCVVFDHCFRYRLHGEKPHSFKSKECVSELAAD